MLAAIGQLAAVFVGIPSLIYLAVQIREQTKERRQSAVNALTVQWGDLTCALHEERASSVAIFLRGVQSFDGSRCGLETQIQRVFQSFLQKLRRNVFLSLRRHTHCGSSMGRDRADDERFHRLPRYAQMVGDAKALAHGRICAASSTQLSPEATSPRLTQLTIYARSPRRKHAHELISRAYIGRARLRRAARRFGGNSQLS